MSLFNVQINNWQDWGNIFQSIPAFTQLVEHILKKENLPLMEIENLTPCTNAVFKVGDYVLKIFAPDESGINQPSDLQTELFATRRANKLDISAPRLIADGFVDDKYRFAYMITDYIEGLEFTKVVKHMTSDEKILFSRKLRNATDKMNTHCEQFNEIDVIHDKSRYHRWDKYTENFKNERLIYIKSHDYGEKVFVHGDLCGDNIMLTQQGELFIIDFADSVLAPKIYEHALIAVDLFDFDLTLLQGYFSDFFVDELTEICFNGLLIHDYGGDIVQQHIGKPGEFQCLNDLRIKLKQIIGDSL